MVTRRTLPNRRTHEVVEFDHGGVRFVAGVGRFLDGTVAEVFMSAGKPGCQAENSARDAGILASLALQHGATVDDLRHSLVRLNNGAAAGPIGALFDLLEAPRG